MPKQTTFVLAHECTPLSKIHQLLDVHFSAAYTSLQVFLNTSLQSSSQMSYQIERLGKIDLHLQKIDQNDQNRPTLPKQLIDVLLRCFAYCFVLKWLISSVQIERLRKIDQNRPSPIICHFCCPERGSFKATNSLDIR